MAGCLLHLQERRKTYETLGMSSDPDAIRRPCLLVGLPKKLTYTHTVLMPGVKGYRLEYNIREYLYAKDPTHLLYSWSDHSLEVYSYDCPPFRVGLHQFKPIITLTITPICRNNSYTIEIIVCCVKDPFYGYIYGENGVPYQNKYSKKQLKILRPILAYASEEADRIFAEIDEYMKAHGADPIR